MEELPLMIESKSKYGSTSSSSSSNCNKTTTTKHPKKNYAIPPGLDKIYQEQLDAAKWNDDVRRRLRNMGELRRIFEKRWILEDLTAFLAVLGIVLGLILDQHMFRMMEWTGVYDYDPYKDSLGRLLRSAITLDTIAVLVLIYYTTQLRVKMQIFREIFLCSLHAPIGVDFHFRIGHTRYSACCLNALMFFRLYLLLRVLRNHSGFNTMQANLVAAMNGVDATDIEFNVKMMLKLQPMSVLGPCLFLNVLALASLLVLFERPDPSSNITSFWSASYVSLVTMSTVGYGDFYPVTTLGKVSAVIFGVVGGCLLATLLITVFCDFSMTTPQEEFVINIVRRRKHLQELRFKSATLLQRAWKLRKLRVKKDPTLRSEMERLERIMYESVRDVHHLRLSIPDDMTAREIHITWMNMIDDIAASLHISHRTLKQKDEDERRRQSTKVEEDEDEPEEVLRGLKDVDESMHHRIWHRIHHEKGPRPCIFSMFHQIELNSEHIETKLERLEKLVKGKLSLKL